MYGYYGYHNEKRQSDFLKKIILWSLALILTIVIGVFVVRIINNFQKKGTDYEALMVKKANNYMEKNSIIIALEEEKYLSFKEIDYQFSNNNCNNSGGLYIYNDGGELQYSPYYVCGTNYSETIDGILKNNETNLIKLRGNNPYILKYYDKYSEYGYDKIDMKSVVTVEDNIASDAGIYYVNYNVITEDEEQTITRIVIREGKETNTSNNVEENYPSVTLKGEDVVYLLKGETYAEAGYGATDNKDGDITKKVRVIGNINTNIKGTYVLSYQVTNSMGKTSTKFRTIIVNDTTVSMIKLIGSNRMSVKKGNQYEEPGYTATYNGKDITDNVVITSNVDTNTIGTYNIIYSVTNSLGQTDNVVRKVTVTYASGSTTPSYKLNVIKEPDEPTSEDVTIVVSGEYERLILPNGVVITEQEAEYNVSSNGQYKFEAQYANGVSRITTVNVTNIDKSIPDGACLLKNNVITVTLKNSGSYTFAYSVNDLTYTTYTSARSYTVPSNNYKAYVRVKNAAGTEETFTCNTSGVVMPQIEVPDKYKNNIIMKEDSETFKVRLVKSGNWYMTYMWMKDPNKQHVMANRNDISGGSISSMMNSATSKNFMGIKNKIAIVTNSDYTAVGWGFACNKGTNYAPIALIINNGKVIRKNTKKECGWPSINSHISPQVAYIDADGNLNVFDNKQSYSESERSAELDKIIASGAYNTFESLRNHKILDYGRYRLFSREKSEHATRIALCQIDSNNYIQFAVTSGVKVVDVATKMKGLGCINAVNLDGGGSSSFGYKKSNDSSFTKVMASTRPNWAISIFTELG